MLTAARCSAQGFGFCLERVNLYYMEVYVKLWEFELKPTRSNLHELLIWGRRGLVSLEYEDEETRMMWTRMFLLRMAFGFLGIGNNGNIIETFTAEKSDLKEAKSLLVEVDKNWEQIEVRREMMYCIAKARLNELLGLIDDALRYLNKGKQLANSGGFLRKETMINHLIEKMYQKKTNIRVCHGIDRTISNEIHSRFPKLQMGILVNEGHEGQNIVEHLNYFRDAEQQCCKTIFTNVHNTNQKTTNIQNTIDHFQEMNISLVHEVDDEFITIEQNSQCTEVKTIDRNEADEANLKTFEMPDETSPKYLLLTNECECSRCKIVVNSSELNSLDTISEDESVNDSSIPHLNLAFHDYSNIGSIALFEDRSMPEGASCPESYQNDI